MDESIQPRPKITPQSFSRHSRLVQGCGLQELGHNLASFELYLASIYFNLSLILRSFGWLFHLRECKIRGTVVTSHQGPFTTFADSKSDPSLTPSFHQLGFLADKHTELPLVE